MMRLRFRNKKKKMESDEKYIESRFGKAQPFKVPEGYFDGLTQSIMTEVDKSSVAEEPCVKSSVGNKVGGLSTQYAQPKNLWWRSRRFITAAAACALLFVGGVSAYHALDHHSELPHSALAQGGDDGSQTQSGVCNDEFDYTMLDNEGMYLLMASN